MQWVTLLYSQNVFVCDKCMLGESGYILEIGVRISHCALRLATKFVVYENNKAVGCKESDCPLYESVSF
jgi:hypothetical protein